MQTTTLNQNRHQNKKISFLISAFPPSFVHGGGVSKRYGRTVEAFGNVGYETHVLTCISNPTMYKNMTYHKFPSINVLGYDCMNILDNLPRIQRIIKGSDMLFVDDTPFASIVCCVANNMGIRAIRTNHTHGASFAPLFLIKLYLCLDGSCSWATTSMQYSRYIQEVYGITCDMVWPTVIWSKLFYTWNRNERAKLRQMQRYKWRQKMPLKDQTKFILFSVGRISPEKRMDLLIDSIPDTAVLILQGDGTERHKKAIATKANATRGCYFWPEHLSAADLQMAYFGCDMFVSASDMETNGLTVVEAIACQTKVAVFPAVGHLESVQDGKNGWYVNFENKHVAREKLTRCLQMQPPPLLESSSKNLRKSQSDYALVTYLDTHVPAARKNVKIPSLTPPRIFLWIEQHRIKILVLILILAVMWFTKLPF